MRKRKICSYFLPLKIIVSSFTIQNKFIKVKKKKIRQVFDTLGVGELMNSSSRR